jgi:hypothetical protein
MLASLGNHVPEIAAPDFSGKTNLVGEQKGKKILFIFLWSLAQSAALLQAPLAVHIQGKTALACRLGNG